MNYSMRLIDCFGLMVRPKPYFSPEGDLGGVSPFWVGEPGYFCIFVMKRGEGGADSAEPGCPDSSSPMSLVINLSVVD